MAKRTTRLKSREVRLPTLWSKREEETRVLEADAVVLALGPRSARSAILSSLSNVSGMKAHSIIVRPPEPNAITTVDLTPFSPSRFLPGFALGIIIEC